MRSDDICKALKRRYPTQECVLMFEVADADRLSPPAPGDAPAI